MLKKIFSAFFILILASCNNLQTMNLGWNYERSLTEIAKSVRHLYLVIDRSTQIPKKNEDLIRKIINETQNILADSCEDDYKIVTKKRENRTYNNSPKSNVRLLNDALSYIGYGFRSLKSFVNIEETNFNTLYVPLIEKSDKELQLFLKGNSLTPGGGGRFTITKKNTAEPKLKKSDHQLSMEEIRKKTRKISSKKKKQSTILSFFKPSIKQTSSLADVTNTPDRKRKRRTSKAQKRNVKRKLSFKK